MINYQLNINKGCKIIIIESKILNNSWMIINLIQKNSLRIQTKILLEIIIQN
jgi:hypothetical protein